MGRWDVLVMQVKVYQVFEILYLVINFGLTCEATDSRRMREYHRNEIQLVANFSSVEFEDVDTSPYYVKCLSGFVDLSWLNYNGSEIELRYEDPSLNFSIPGISIQNSEHHSGIIYYPRENIDKSLQWNFLEQCVSICTPDVTYYPYDKMTCAIAIFLHGVDDGNDISFIMQRMSFGKMEKLNNWSLQRHQSNCSGHMCNMTLSFQRNGNVYTVLYGAPCALFAVLKTFSLSLRMNEKERRQVHKVILSLSVAMQIIIFLSVPSDDFHIPIIMKIISMQLLVTSFVLLFCYTSTKLRNKVSHPKNTDRKGQDVGDTTIVIPTFQKTQLLPWNSSFCLFAFEMFVVFIIVCR